MLKNYFKIAFRSLWKSKVNSVINIAGLGLGIAVCLLILLFLRDEWTFDTFHTKADRIYRVWGKEDYGADQKFFWTTTPFPMGPTLKENFKVIEAQVRLNPMSAQLKVGESIYTEPISVAGEDFFTVFDFKVIDGDLSSALHHQSDVVITRRAALKFFGDQSPINKTISVQPGESFEDYVVKAVIENIPTNSGLQFDILISDLNFPKIIDQRTLTSGWFNISPETYILLQDGADPEALVKEFPRLFKTLLGESYEKSHYTVGLQPLTDIHLNTDFPAGNAPAGNPRYSYIMAAIAGLILLVACINFITLSVGRSLKRAKEVGIRKVVGAGRTQLMGQFIGEAVLVTMISMIAGMMIAALSIPLFNELSGKSLSIPIDGFMVGVGICLISIIGLLAGSYPAFFLSGIVPVSILKGSATISPKGGKQNIRKVLVGIQLVLSIFLISSTLIMRSQLDYLKNKSLGFDREALAVVQLNVPQTNGLAKGIEAGFKQVRQFRIELSNYPDLAESCGSSHDFGTGGWTNLGYTDDNATYRTFNCNTVDENYLSVMKVQLKEGRNFSAANPSDAQRAIIVNEAFIKEHNMENPIGKRLPGKSFADHEIIGVVKDFNYASLYTKVEPLLLTMDITIPLSGAENINIDNSPVPKLFVRLKPGTINQSIEHLEEVWKRLNPAEEFSFSFVDQRLEAQYRNDQNLGKIVTLAALLALIIGSLGLYALASLAMQNRTKEISIRKVLGATEQSLLILLSKDYVLMIGISLLASIPVTWYLMNTWLQTFEYRVNIGWQFFAMAGMLALLVTFLTISYRAIKTSRAKPVDTLKYE
jgi:putative ABC transport system permease protein